MEPIKSNKGTKIIELRPSNAGVTLLIKNPKFGTRNSIHIFDECISAVMAGLQKHLLDKRKESDV